MSPPARLTKEEVEKRLEELGPVTARGNFDEIRNALFACVALCGEVFDDVGLRTLVSDTIESSWGKVPITVRIDVLASLSQTAIDKADQSAARRYLDKAMAMANGAQWLPEERVPVIARLADLRFRAGDAEGARTIATDALAFYKSERERMINIDRADALRPLAEATSRIVGKAEALEVFRLAIEEGMENPNSRPRAEDVALTCASMARADVEPDAALTARLAAIVAGLGAPW